MIFPIFPIFLAFFIDFSLANWGNWNWGNPPPPPQIPNNNVGIGYPTAYGLYTGRGYGNNYGQGGPPNAGAGFGSPLRCLNGGAHIGQCRLDKDSICIALGGTCTHGACCTTPFVSMGITTEEPEVIDGETTRKKGNRGGKKVTVAPEIGTTRKKKSSEESGENSEEMNSYELEEWNRLINQAKTSTNSPPIDIVTVAPVVEENEDRKCTSGLRSVGPCSEDSDCPTLHQCESEQCCYLVI